MSARRCMYEVRLKGGARSYGYYEGRSPREAVLKAIRAHDHVMPECDPLLMYDAILDGEPEPETLSKDDPRNIENQVLICTDPLVGRTVADIAARVGLSPSRTRTALRRLAWLGLVESSKVPQHAGDTARMETVWKAVRS